MLSLRSSSMYQLVVPSKPLSFNPIFELFEENSLLDHILFFDLVSDVEQGTSIFVE